MIREDVELFIWRGRRRGADVACSLADLDRANHRELEAMNDREWATKLADSIWVSLIPRIWGLALPDNPITVKELIQEQLLLALAKRGAELSRPATPTIVCPHCNAELGEYPLWATLCHHVAQRCTGPLREKRSGNDD